ncbi:unknown protein [Seminavis robusta]|uniref:Ricin B lectin domain-containing protein n=1 Tax=Seminavis robusta TaxID=568900 RepID=A0A9N8EUX8_9STRA|nr:unknown protein [Seminavis robusta]|eukprot:Sro1756_g295590.1 n/a (172) ;mRNA; f:3994-4509
MLPSSEPSKNPSAPPSESPSLMPSSSPSLSPSQSPTAMPSPSPTVYGTGPIVNVATNECITVATATNSERIYLAPCDGSINQRWLYDTSTKAIKPVSDGGICFDHDIDSANIDVTIYNCHGLDNQQWFSNDRNELKWFTDTERNSILQEKCMDYDGSNFMVMLDCDGSNNQ